MAEARPEPRTPEEERAADHAGTALNRLAKWRAIFAGWQLGTRPKGDPESDAVRDHREVSILLRAEVSTLVGLLVDKGVFTSLEWTEALASEAERLSADYEQRFPGMRPSDDGMVLDARSVETMRGWRL